MLNGLVDKEEIRRLTRRIVDAFAPQRIILFGSYAYGRPTPDSGVDLLVVLPFQQSNFRMSLEILNRIDARIPLDLLARRPDDVAFRYRHGDPLIREALDHGTVLYESDRG